MPRLYVTSDLHLDSLVHHVFGGTYTRPSTRKAVKLVKDKGVDYGLAIGALFFREMFKSLPPADPDGILILAGDIWIGHKMFSFHNCSWIKHVCSMFKHVVVVAGNHCLWSSLWGTWHAKAERLKQEQELHNLHILEDSFVDLDGLRFIGATLWTDMYKHDPFAIMDSTRVMNDFQYIKKLTPQKWLQKHQRSRDYIKHVLDNSKDKQCVVVTHHAPCYNSVAHQYRASSTSAFYWSDLTDLMFDRENLPLWAHGHTHNVSDYMLDNTRVVCYPVGYERFKPNFVCVEI